MSILTAKKPEEIKVHMLMTQSVCSVHPDFSVNNIASILIENHISSVPVVEDNTAIVGFVTLGDCLKSLVNGVFHNQDVQRTASDIMAKEIKSIDEDSDIFELESFFLNQNLHQAPVTNKAGQLVGMVSRRDALAGIKKLVAETRHYKQELKKPLQITLSEKM